jgi:hypothetical protein
MAVGQTQPYVGHILDLPKDLSKGAVNVVAVKN